MLDIDWLIGISADEAAGTVGLRDGTVGMRADVGCEHRSRVALWSIYVRFDGETFVPELIDAVADETPFLPDGREGGLLSSPIYGSEGYGTVGTNGGGARAQGLGLGPGWKRSDAGVEFPIYGAEEDLLAGGVALGFGA